VPTPERRCSGSSRRCRSVSAAARLWSRGLRPRRGGVVEDAHCHVVGCACRGAQPCADQDAGADQHRGDDRQRDQAPIGRATPTSRSGPPRGQRNTRCSMSVPPVLFAWLGFFDVGVEGLELARAGVPVQRHPHAPPSSHQQSFPLASALDSLELVRAELDAILRHLVSLAVLELAVPLIGRRALQAAPDLPAEPRGRQLRQRVDLDTVVPPACGQVVQRITARLLPPRQ
jgi:hypothetical protein